MYHDCKLVHADLSEYNILIHDEHLYIIDVSQSVEHDHPSAFDFLRNDIRNVEEFFARRGVKCLGLRSCFEFVTRENLGSPTIDSSRSMEEVLRQWLEDMKLQESKEEAEEDTIDGTAEQNDETKKAHEDAIFLHSFIPRALNEVYDPERDIERLTKGQGESLIYAKTIGVVAPITGAQASPPLDEGTSSDRIEIENLTFAGEILDGNPHEKQPYRHSQDSDTSEDDEKASDNDTLTERKPRGHRHEDRDAKKV